MLRGFQALDRKRMGPGGGATNAPARRTDTNYGRLLQAGMFMLPLLRWEGLGRAFVTPKMLLLAGLDVLAGACLIFGTRRRLVPARSGEWPWLMWLGAVALSAAFGRHVSLEAFLLMLLPIPLAWTLFEGVLPADRVVRGLIWGSAVASAIAVLQYCLLDPLGLVWRPDLYGSTRMRVYGTLGNPNFVAAWLCSILPLYSSVAATGRKRLLWGLELALQLGAILATGSRLILVALPAIAVAMSLRHGRWAKWSLADCRWRRPCCGSPPLGPWTLPSRGACTWRR